MIKFQNSKISPWVFVDIIDKSFIKDTKIKFVIKTVQDHYDVRMEELKGKNRAARLVMPRRVLSYILHRVYGYGSVEVGKLINRDHSTILHHCKTVSNFVEYDKEFKAELELIMNK